MSTYKYLKIGSLTGFAQAPHPEARMVLASHLDDPRCDQIEQAGWLMPQIAEVHPKTARWQRHMARYAKENSNGEG